MKEKKVSVADILLCVANAVLFLGTKLIFHGCEVMEGESVMACHWAENAVFGIAAVMLCLSVIMLISKSAGARLWLSVAMIPSAVLAILVPGTLINLCMMAEMRCHSVMRPSVTIVSVIIILLSVFNVVTEIRKKK